MFKLKFEPCVRQPEVLDEWRAGSGFIGDYVYNDLVGAAVCIIDTPCGQGIGETRDRLRDRPRTVYAVFPPGELPRIVPCCRPDAKPDLLAITKTFLRERGE